MISYQISRILPPIAESWMRTATESNTKTKRPSGASMLLIAVLDRFVILIKVNTLQPYTDISSIIINNMLSYICIVPLL